MQTRNQIAGRLSRALTPALLAAAVSGCATIGKPTVPMLPSTAGYMKDQTVALLLPSSADGFLGDAVKAIDAGYAAAKSSDNGKAANKPATTNHDTAGKATEAFGTAAADNPSVVIGPLLKDRVTAVMAERGTTGVPMLALNEVLESNKGVYQFGLAPEDESKTVARIVNKMHAEVGGVGKPAVVFPRNDEWAESMRAAFVGKLTKDNKPAVEVAYDAAAPGDLQAKVAGAGSVFMIARPGDASAVYTALGGSDAEIPVIATSHATDEKADAGDMEGLFYVDVPWVVQTDSAKAFAERLAKKPDSKYQKGQFGRLFAMGVDAYYLGAQVANPGQSSGGSAAPQLPAGMTGALAFSPSGRLVTRELALGRFGPGNGLAPATTAALMDEAKPKPKATKPEADEEAAAAGDEQEG
jgi:outer membrane PBP1 activator LpoA protein